MVWERLGNLIENINERNTDLKVSLLLGVNLDKKFFPSIANIIGTDLSTYKIVRKGQFACKLMSVGRDGVLPLGFLEDYDEAIVSGAYYAFKVKDETIILPQYLMLCMSRKEFDRELWFRSGGDVRGGTSWEELCSIKIPVPTLEEQQQIVNSYKSIEERIKLKKQINDNLESQAYTYYQDKIVDKDKDSTLSDLAIITMGTSPDGESFNDIGNGVVFYQGRTDFGFRFPTIRLYTTEPKRFAEKNDILMSVRAPVGDINIAKDYCAIGRGIASIRPKDGCYSFLFYTLKQLNHELQRFNDDGTVFGSITKDDLFALKIVSLSAEDRRQFDEQISKIDALIKDNETEIANLELACSLLLSRLAN